MIFALATTPQSTLLGELPTELELLDLAINLLLVLVLGFVLGWHFVRFGQVLSNKRKLARVLVFVSATTLLIISVVKVSLALSLGLVGALSIIRFRTPVKEPEELAYLFLAIAVGVGLGADRRLETALVFVVILTAMALRHGLPGGKAPLLTILQVSKPGPLDAERAPLDALLPAVSDHCARVDLRRVDASPDEFHASLLVEIAAPDRLQPLLDGIQKAVPGATISVVERDGLD
ncbi:MAG: DUF4956 domain-containing protein [bacterium]|nr:DUF4956 domain-containing protein [bacterium]